MALELFESSRKAKEALDEVRADPRSYLHFVTLDVVKYVLQPFVTAEAAKCCLNPGRWPYIFYEVSCVCHFLDGKQFGLQQKWDPDGRLIHELPFVDGNPHGLKRRWHPSNGALISKAPYVDGKKHGLVQRVKFSGEHYQQDIENYWVNGVQRGFQRHWRPNQDDVMTESLIVDNTFQAEHVWDHVAGKTISSFMSQAVADGAFDQEFRGQSVSFKRWAQLE